MPTFVPGDRFLVPRFVPGDRFLVPRFVPGDHFLVPRFVPGDCFLVPRFVFWLLVLTVIPFFVVVFFDFALYMTMYYILVPCYEVECLV